MRLTTFTVKKLKSVNGEVNSARNNKKEEEEKFSIEDRAKKQWKLINYQTIIKYELK